MEAPRAQASREISTRRINAEYETYQPLKEQVCHFSLPFDKYLLNNYYMANILLSTKSKIRNK